MIVVSSLNNLLVMQFSLQPINLSLHHSQLSLQSLEYLADEATAIVGRQQGLLLGWTKDVAEADGGNLTDISKISKAGRELRKISETRKSSESSKPSGNVKR